eukprot:SAG11_NODE_124_length_15798_cov_14.675776_4_plen_57_part_00
MEVHVACSRIGATIKGGTCARAKTCVGGVRRLTRQLILGTRVLGSLRSGIFGVSCK